MEVRVIASGTNIRFLFAMFQGGSNIPLIMPIVSELVSRGHDVRVIDGPGIRRSRSPISEAWMQRLKDSGAQRVPFDGPQANQYTRPATSGVALGWMPRR